MTLNNVIIVVSIRDQVTNSHIPFVGFGIQQSLHLLRLLSVVSETDELSMRTKAELGFLRI